MIEETPVEANIPTFLEKISGFILPSAYTIERGYLTPLIKGLFHVMYLISRLQDGRTRNMDLIKHELNEALTHFNNISLASHKILSERMRTRTDDYINIMNLFKHDAENWAKDETIANSKLLWQATLQLAVELDYDLMGLSASPGTSL